MTSGQRRPMVISPLWLQGVILTFVFGFTVLGYLALRVYQDHAPIPAKVVSETTGETVFTGEDVLHGQEMF
jgi:nitric oxide reductase subunit B